MYHEFPHSSARPHHADADRMSVGGTSKSKKRTKDGSTTAARASLRSTGGFLDSPRNHQRESAAAVIPQVLVRAHSNSVVGNVAVEHGRMSEAEEQLREGLLEIELAIRDICSAAKTNSKDVGRNAQKRTGQRRSPSREGKKKGNKKPAMRMRASITMDNGGDFLSSPLLHEILYRNDTTTTNQKRGLKAPAAVRSKPGALGKGKNSSDATGAPDTNDELRDEMRNLLTMYSNALNNVGCVLSQRLQEHISREEAKVSPASLSSPQESSEFFGTQVNAAVECFRRAQEVDTLLLTVPSCSSMLNLSVALLLAGNLDEAEVIARNCVVTSEDPSSPPLLLIVSLHNLAVILLEKARVRPQTRDHPVSESTERDESTTAAKDCLGRAYALSLEKLGQQNPTTQMLESKLTEVHNASYAQDQVSNEDQREHTQVQYVSSHNAFEVGSDDNSQSHSYKATDASTRKSAPFSSSATHMHNTAFASSTGSSSHNAAYTLQSNRERALLALRTLQVGVPIVAPVEDSTEDDNDTVTLNQNSERTSHDTHSKKSLSRNTSKREESRASRYVEVESSKSEVDELLLTAIPEQSSRANVVEIDMSAELGYGAVGTTAAKDTQGMNEKPKLQNSQSTDRRPSSSRTCAQLHQREGDATSVDPVHEKAEEKDARGTSAKRSTAEQGRSAVFPELPDTTPRASNTSAGAKWSLQSNALEASALRSFEVGSPVSITSVVDELGSKSDERTSFSSKRHSNEAVPVGTNDDGATRKNSKGKEDTNGSKMDLRSSKTSSVVPSSGLSQKLSFTASSVEGTDPSSRAPNSNATRPRDVTRQHTQAFMNAGRTADPSHAPVSFFDQELTEEELELFRTGQPPPVTFATIRANLPHDAAGTAQSESGADEAKKETGAKNLTVAAPPLRTFDVSKKQKRQEEETERKRAEEEAYLVKQKEREYKEKLQAEWDRRYEQVLSGTRHKAAGVIQAVWRTWWEHVGHPRKMEIEKQRSLAVSRMLDPDTHNLLISGVDRDARYRSRMEKMLGWASDAGATSDSAQNRRTWATAASAVAGSYVVVRCAKKWLTRSRVGRLLVKLGLYSPLKSWILLHMRRNDDSGKTVVGKHDIRRFGWWGPPKQTDSASGKGGDGNSSASHQHHHQSSAYKPSSVIQEELRSIVAQITRIQCWWRQQLGKRAVRIQRQECVAGWQPCLMSERQHFAALRIQTNVRRILAKKRARAMWAAKYGGPAKYIQIWFRVTQHRRKELGLDRRTVDRRNRAASRIQRAWRQHEERVSAAMKALHTHLLDMRLSETNSYQILQRCGRGYKVRTDMYFKLEEYCQEMHHTILAIEYAQKAEFDAQQTAKEAKRRVRFEAYATGALDRADAVYARTVSEREAHYIPIAVDPVVERERAALTEELNVRPLEVRRNRFAEDDYCVMEVMATRENRAAVTIQREVRRWIRACRRHREAVAAGATQSLSDMQREIYQQKELGVLAMRAARDEERKRVVKRTGEEIIAPVHAAREAIQDEMQDVEATVRTRITEAEIRTRHQRQNDEVRIQKDERVVDHLARERELDLMVIRQPFLTVKERQKQEKSQPKKQRRLCEGPSTSVSGTN